MRSVFFDLGLCLKAKVFWCAGPRLRRCPLILFWCAVSWGGGREGGRRVRMRLFFWGLGIVFEGEGVLVRGAAVAALRCPLIFVL